MATLAELREQTALWLDDPKMTKFSAARLTTLLNMAYPMIVGLVESAGRLWNVGDTLLTIEVTPDQREYAVESADVAASRVRRIIDVRRVVNVGRPQVPFVILTEVNRSGSGYYYPQLEGWPQTTGVYLFRTSGSVWTLGFAMEQPPAQSLEIRFVEEVCKLVADADEPTMVPRGYHHVLAMQAAVIGKGSEERVNSTLEAHFELQKRAMLGECKTQVAGRSQRI